MYTILGIIILYYCFKFIKQIIKKSPEKERVTSDFLEQLVRLLFDEGSEIVLKDLHQLKATPTDFVNKHPAIFAPYGIDEADESDFEGLCKITLAYHLGQQQNYLVLDWKQSGYDGLNSINWLLNANGISTIPVTEKEGVKRAIVKKHLVYGTTYFFKTEELIIYVASMLTKEGVSMIEIALGGDSYELFLMPNRKIPEFVDLMNQLAFDFQIMR